MRAWGKRLGVCGKVVGAVLVVSVFRRIITRRRAAKERATLKSFPPSHATTISIVIPALNEAKNIQRAIESTGLNRNASGVVEVIVVDGGSSDSTVEVASGCGAKVLSSPKGRGVQLINGAREAKGDVLLFLHADSALPPRYNEDIIRGLGTPVRGQLPVWGCFEHVAIQMAGRMLRLLEKGIALRTRVRRVPYGGTSSLLLIYRSAIMRNLPITL
mmetsp:Transcript_39392/g.85727  ORF Transcript_39392/g.85727 Transcript_39392/m.85727 type:complete len:216 (-) Transcript_39392:13-660(-)